jgi:nucleotide-binding universal stress UspA family protein
MTSIRRFGTKVMESPTSWRLLHPTDLSPASDVAFAHALKIALLTGGELRILHVAGSEGGVGPTGFPRVRDTLERWAVLPAGSPDSAVGALGITVDKVEAFGADPVTATVEFLARHAADVVVMATHRRDGFARWREPSVAEAIARHAGEIALFVPEGAASFVSPVTGMLGLRRMLIPVDHAPSPQPAIDAAAAMASLAGDERLTLRLLHIGDGPMPPMETRAHETWTWERRTEPGTPVEALVTAVQRWEPDLVVMSTEGRHGLMDALRGSTSERVLRSATCPVLAVSGSARALPRLRALGRQD